MMAATAAAGAIFLFGGASGDPIRNRDDAFSFDLRTQSWQCLRPLPEPMRGAAAVALDDRHIVLCGGYSSHFRSDVLIYEIQSDCYFPADPLRFGLMGAEFSLAGNLLIGAGGEDRIASRSPWLLRAKVY
jgi:hypothetical protein